MNLTKDLETIIRKKGRKNKALKVMVTSDYHIPFMDIGAYEIMKQKVKDYRPDVFVINGDFLDCYTLSFFDKNPSRKQTFNDEIELGKKYLQDIRSTLPKSSKLYLIAGNHENRLEKNLWKNPETYEVMSQYANLPILLNLQKNKVDFIGVNSDYWKNDNGHLEIGDMLIMHGDNRLNGASTSKYSGYSAKNTVSTMGTNVTIGHCHRLALHYSTTPYRDMIGIEGGMLAMHTGTANWQQGFVTFESLDNKTINPRLYHIHKQGQERVMYDNGKIYKVQGSELQ